MSAALPEPSMATQAIPFLRWSRVIRMASFPPSNSRHGPQTQPSKDALLRQKPNNMQDIPTTTAFSGNPIVVIQLQYSMRALGFERFARARVSRAPYGTRQSLDEPCRRPERLSRSSAAMGRAQCITATPRKRGLHSFKVLEDHRQPAASDRRTTKATFSSRHFRPRWRRL